MVRHGTTRHGKQRYRCRETLCAGRTLLLTYAYAGQSPEVKRQIVERAMHSRGMRDTARVLHVSPTTVIRERKKQKPHLQQGNQSVLQHLHPAQVEVGMCQAEVACAASRADVETR